MKKITLAIITGIVFPVICASGCGKKIKDGNDNPPPYISSLALGSDAMNYAIKVLASSNKTSPSATMASILDQNTEPVTASYSVQDPDLTDCSMSGEPWDKASSSLMTIANSKYAQTLIYCQVNSRQGSETLAGSINRYKAILCDLERVIGSIIYTESGTEYKDRSLTVTEACGWSHQDLGEMSGQAMTANLTAYSISSGDWQKRVHVTVPTEHFDFNIYFTIKSDFVGFKFVENWDQTELMQSGNYNANIPSTITGTRGTIVTIDPTNAVLRAESVDTYLGRRFRFYIKGTLDSTVGIFRSVTNGEVIVASFDQRTGLDGQVATATGNDSDGFTYGAYRYASSNPSSVRSTTTVSTNTTACSVTGGCAGQTAISFSAEAADLDFLMIGAVWDMQTGTRRAVETWINSAGSLTQANVSKAVTL